MTSSIFNWNKNSMTMNTKWDEAIKCLDHVIQLFIMIRGECNGNSLCAGLLTALSPFSNLFVVNLTAKLDWLCPRLCF